MPRDEARAKLRPIIHRVPVRVDDGSVKVRYFRTATEANEFAKEQARKRGDKGFTYDSLPFAAVAELLEQHAPIPDYWLAEREKGDG